MIHYITIWGENNIGRNLSYSPAGLKKAKYVVDVLSRIDTTKIVSFANGGCKWNGLYRKTTQEWNDDISIEYCFIILLMFSILCCKYPAINSEF